MDIKEEDTFEIKIRPLKNEIYIIEVSGDGAKEPIPFSDLDKDITESFIKMCEIRKKVNKINP